MTMQNLALLASQNGLGHSRRLFYVGSALQEMGFKVTLFVGAVQSESLQKEMSKGSAAPNLKVIKPIEIDGPHIPIVNFQTSSTFELLLKKNTHLISDNVVFNRPDSLPYYLHGHFNWVDFDIVTKRRKDIPVTQKPSYGNLQGWFMVTDFQLQSDIPESKRHLMPFLRYRDLHISDRPQVKNLIWVSKGTTSDFDSASLCNLKKSFPRLTFLDCESFRLKEQNELPLAVVGRPGLGTIRDCLEAGVAFVPIGGKFDVELESNVRHLVRLGLLADAFNPNYALEVILNDPENRSRSRHYWEKNSISMYEYASRVAKVIS